MIPFFLVNGMIQLQSGETLEIGLEELAGEYFTFRLSCSWLAAHDWQMQIQSVTLYFLCIGENGEIPVCDNGENYRSIVLLPDSGADDSFEITYFQAADEGEISYFFAQVSVKSLQFAQESRKLSKQYLQYIYDKMNLPPEEVAAARSDYPVNRDDVFCSNLAEQLEKWKKQAAMVLDKPAAAEALRRQFCSHRFGWGISLESGETQKLFLAHDREAFLQAYADRYLGKAYPICSEDCRDLFLGNAFCPHLFPQGETFCKLYEKAIGDGWNVHLVLAPIPQSMLEKWISIINYVNQYHEAHFADIPLIWQANDWGIYSYCKENAENRILAEKGPLLIKSYRDPRMKYLQDGRPLYMKSETAVYLPFYQTNTATFCTLKAIAERGDRGKGCREAACDRICEQAGILYPEHLQMIGRYNSLFGYDERGLTDPDFLLDYVNNGFQLFVFNY